MKIKKREHGGIKIVLMIFFLFAVICPLFSLFVHLKDVDVAAVLNSGSFRKSLGNSILSASLSTICSVSAGFILAWCIAKSRIRYKSLLSIIFTLPMLIPSISHGMGLVILFGQNGVITNLLQLKGSIYGLSGIVLGSVVYSFPVAFLMFVDILSYEDNTVYAAADILGIPKWNQFLTITFPYLRKPLISVVFTVFTMIVTDYGVPLMVGGKFMTLPVMMYQEVIGLLDFGKGSVIGIVMIVPALITFLLDALNRDKGNQTFVADRMDIRKHIVRDVICGAICVIAGIFVILPIIAFALLTFIKKYPIDMTVTLYQVKQTLELNMGRYLLNSLVIAVIVSIIGVCIAYVTAYVTSRGKGKASKGLHLVSITSLTIPGMVLGLSYVLFFKNTFFYGTMAILILVNTVHFFASSYLMAYNSFGKMNENLEAVGETLGIGRFYLIKDVFIPQMKTTIAEMFSYFFVNSMITISAVSFLSKVDNMPLALMIPQFEAQMLLESSACVSLVILFINLVVKGIVYVIKKRDAVM